MHELGITQTVLEVALEHATAHGASRIVMVHLQAGRMHNLAEESLTFYFEHLGRGTMAEGAVLVVETVPIQAICAHCSHQFVLAQYEWLCPQCDSAEFEIVAGKELMVTDIKVE